MSETCPKCGKALAVTACDDVRSADDVAFYCKTPGCGYEIRLDDLLAEKPVCGTCGRVLSTNDHGAVQPCEYCLTALRNKLAEEHANAIARLDAEIARLKADNAALKGIVGELREQLLATAKVHATAGRALRRAGNNEGAFIHEMQAHHDSEAAAEQARLPAGGQEEAEKGSDG